MGGRGHHDAGHRHGSCHETRDPPMFGGVHSPANTTRVSEEVNDIFHGSG